MGLLTWLRQEPQLRRLVLFVACMALFLDHMLLSVVVPILPSYLYSMQYNASTSENLSSSTVGPTVQSSRNSSSNCSEDLDLLDSESIQLGVLMASKPVIQLITNPFVGSLTDRIGYHIPLCVGFCIIFIASTMFAFSSPYILLLLARSLQGFGGSCLCVSGPGLVASLFTDETERGRAMAFCFTGTALGLVAGAPFGGALYEFMGKPAPFLCLALVSALTGGVHFLIFTPARMDTERQQGTPLLTLLRDPHILICAGAICFTTMAVAALEACLPLWMMETMCPRKWLLGFVFLPDSLSYLIASNIFGSLSYKIGRWLCVFIGLILTGLSLICFRFSTNIYHLMALNGAIGFSVGIVDSTGMPLIGSLVDQRHVPVYGMVYAIADVAVSLGFFIGPAVGGPIVALMDFPFLVACFGTVNLLYAPLCLVFLRPCEK